MEFGGITVREAVVILIEVTLWSFNGVKITVAP